MIRLAKMNLVEPGNRCSLPEIAGRWGNVFLPACAFDCEFGAPIASDHEIDLPPVGVTQVPQLHLLDWLLRRDALLPEGRD